MKHALIILLLFALTGCRKETPCERTRGDLLISNTSENSQRVSIGMILAANVDGLSDFSVFDLTPGNYEVKAVNLETGATACVFVKIEACKESMIKI